MKNKRLLFPFISFALIALFSAQAAFLYQKIEQNFKLQEYQIPQGNWHQGIASLVKNVDQIDSPAVSVNLIKEAKAKKTKTKRKMAHTKSKRAKINDYKRISYSYKAKNEAKTAVSIASASLVAKPLHFASMQPIQTKAINNQQLISHHGFTWKVLSASGQSLLAMWEEMAGEKQLLALESTRLADEQRLAAVESKASASEEKVEIEVPQDSISLAAAAPDKELRELVVNSDLEDQSLDSAQVTTQATAQEVANPINEVANAEQDEQAIAAEQQQVWAKLKNEKKVDVSDSVAQAISSAKVAMRSNGQNSFIPQTRDYSRRLASVTTQINSATDALKKRVSSQPHQINLQVTAAKIGKGFDKELSNFAFVPQYDEKQASHDLDGIILLENSLTESHSLLSGTIVKDGYLPLKIDLALDSSEEAVEVNLPLIETNQYGNFLDKLELMGQGAHLLVEVNEGIVDVELDTAYESKIFLDGELKAVGQDDDYQFVLIVGAKVGNSLMSYITADGETADRIIFLPDATVTYDFATIEKSSKSRLKLMQQTPFAVKPQIFDINERDFLYFNTDQTSEQFAPGVYDIKKPIHPQHFRHYFEMRHIDGSIFVGIDKAKEIEVPSVELMASALGGFNIESLEGQCLIQINLKKKAYALRYSGLTANGGMSTEAIYLEKNGKFETEISPISRKVFINGQGQGVIDIKVEYLDDTVDYLQTYCSPNTYLLEQL